MKAKARPTTEAGATRDHEATLGALVDELTDRLRDGEAVDLEACVRLHPGLEGQLRGLFPALEMMAALARSAGRARPGSGQGPTTPAGDDPRLESGVLGDYRIVREAGRGGMGIVFEAWQVSLGRRVALKILPLAASADPRHLRRFRLEAQAAGHLHHPHIVPVHAVGSERGVHYYAMQFIEGRSLADLARDLRRGPASTDVEDDPRPAGRPTTLTRPATPGPAAPPPSGPAPPPPMAFVTSSREVARLGVQAAEALEHAHGLGIVHRDIKPANLLIQPDGHLWVADFGLARFGAEDDLTRTGDLLGTLRYMSPEQATARRVAVDHRTDIYSLGATLYELLAGRPAFDGHDRQELLRRIAQEDPAPPRRADPSIPRDLETAVLKAMAKEPEGRYATAGEMADDLRRFLADEPVRARRPAAPERAARWARRHRVALTSAAAALVLALGVGSALLWRQALRTERAYDQQRKILNLFFSRQERANMEGMAIVTRANNRGLGDDGSYYRTVRDVFQDMIDEAGDDPDMAELKARSHHRVGFCRMMLGDLAGAEDGYRRSVALLDGLIARSPEDRNLGRLLASTLGDRGAMLRRAGRPAAAEADYRRAIGLRRQAALRLVPDPPGLAELAWHQLEWAGLLDQQGRPAEAERARGQLDDLHRAIGPRLPDGPGDRLSYARAHLDYARPDGPGPAHRDAGTMLALALRLDPDDPVLLNDAAWLLAGDPSSRLHDPARALGLASAAVAKAPRQGEFWNTLGVARYRSGDSAGAVEALGESTRLRRGGDAYDWCFLAMAHHRLGHADDARRWLAEIARAARGSPPADEELTRFRAEAESLLGRPPVRE